MKINPKAITQEFLSMINGLEFREQVGTIYDIQGKLVELSSTDKQMARRQARIMKQKFKDEFDNEIQGNHDYEEKITREIGNVINKLITYLKGGDSTLTITNYRDVIRREELFNEFFIGKK